MRALEVVGSRWTIVVLREAFNGVRRFEDFQRHLGVSPSVLSNRLREMTDDGLLRREPYREEGTRERHEYHPTTKAWDLYPVVVGLMQWGDRYLGDGDGPPVHLVDTVTGRPVIAAVVPHDTATCAPSTITVVPGASCRVATTP
ncbi:putative transcriptional regulator, HxlR family [Frankia canadensis]|uniref:Putative transcriptional regulator, HxlR family n=1 Tax=Frankia canadensis TaxID=1836972 RepID=A0A2I2KZI4_9ACTN|nr:helix-turn-helix domain-containing protein [Frankia canadensis]SNQ51067.1 putative transcriptional regulator, HxlR family [Frankia canadensis]SOU58357.1 putative transcriptional regulator, HxlR family [Frankia canadensis]